MYVLIACTAPMVMLFYCHLYHRPGHFLMVTCFTIAYCCFARLSPVELFWVDYSQPSRRKLPFPFYSNKSKDSKETFQDR